MSLSFDNDQKAQDEFNAKFRTAQQSLQNASGELQRIRAVADEIKKYNPEKIPTALYRRMGEIERQLTNARNRVNALQQDKDIFDAQKRILAEDIQRLQIMRETLQTLKQVVTQWSSVADRVRNEFNFQQQ